ncbi:MAG: hypothetical protein ACRD2L_06170, partial [Terriglobia bacterium]
ILPQTPRPTGLSDLFQLASQGDAGAFRQAAISLGASSQETSRMLLRASRTLGGDTASAANRGVNFIEELENLAKPKSLPLAMPPVPTSPSEAAQLFDGLKAQLTGKAPAVREVTNAEAARVLDKEYARRQMIASIRQDIGEDAAVQAEKNLPRVFAATDDAALQLFNDTLEDLTPENISRFAAQWGKMCLRP